ncbi:FtsB family cell division protein [Paenibacillus marinisediminis]
MASVHARTRSVEANRNTEKLNATVRKGTKRRLQLWLLFICVFLCWSGYTYVSQMFTMQDLEQEKQARGQEHKEALEIRNNLQEEVDKLDTTEYILQIARSRGMKLPDERFIRKQEE